MSSVHEIYYNYPNINLYYEDITKDTNDTNIFDYIKMPDITENTFVYTVNTDSTVDPAINIYLREINTVTIPGFTNVGDQVLIIEHYNTTNTNEKYYTAFKLTDTSVAGTVAGTGTEQIKELLDLTESTQMSLDLNDIIDRPMVSGTCNVYKDIPTTSTTSTTKFLFVFDNVDIKINAALTGLKEVKVTDPFYIAPVGNTVPTTVEQILVVNAPDKIEVECTPVEVEGDENEILYGFSAADITDYSALHSTTLFYFFAFTMTILSFVIPPLYKLFVIDFINYASYAKQITGVNDNFAENIDSEQKGVYLHEWNLLLIFFNLLVIFSIFMTTISDKTGLTVGVFYIIVFIFSFSLIYMKTNDKDFMTTNMPKPSNGVAVVKEIDYNTSYDWVGHNTLQSLGNTFMYILFGNRKLINGLLWGFPALGFWGWWFLGRSGILQPSILVLLTFSCTTIMRLMLHSFVIKQLRTDIAPAKK